MILAAGRGERMRPLTDKVPKPLLRAGDKSLIEHTITALVCAGFTDLVINHAYLGSSIETALGNGSKYGARIQYSPESDQALETGGGIYRALPLLGDCFLVVNGDVWTDYPFNRLHRIPEGLVHLVLIDNPPHHPQGDFALLQNNVLRNDGFPKLTFAGIGLYRATLFDGCLPGRFPLAPLLRKAINDGRASGERYEGKWLDVGTPQRLAELNQLLK